MKKLFPLCLAAAFLSGCGMGGPGFKRAYDGYSASIVSANSNLETCTEPQVIPFNPAMPKSEIMDYLTKNGYQVIGSSNFNGIERKTDPVTGWDQKDAVKLGRELGACLILYAENYKGTSTMVVPITTPTTSTTNMSGTLFGAGGMSSYSGTATTSGTETTYMPLSLPVYSFATYYAVKVKPKVKPIQKCSTTLGVTDCDVRLPE